MTAMTPGELTEQVLDAHAGAPEPRLRELLAALVRHLHSFATETRLTREEWLAGLEFLTAVGQKCDPRRQEFILLSDVLGLSSLVDMLNASPGATESTVLGPFHVAGAPERALGEHIGRPEDGPAVLVRGRVADDSGDPVPGAILDVWQASSDGLYDTQDPGQPAFNLRGIFRTGPDGRYEFRTARPASYPIPVDGPVGGLLRAAARGHWRAAHIHVIVSGPGCVPVTTHVFDADNPYLGSDAVFGVKDSLVRKFVPAGPADPADVEYVVDMDFVIMKTVRVTADLFGSTIRRGTSAGETRCKGRGSTMKRARTIIGISVLGITLGTGLAAAVCSAPAMAVGNCPGVVTQAQVAPPAGDTQVINAQMTVTNDEDSGFVGYWALDNYTKHIQVWADPSGTSFYVAVMYQGTWQTFAGALSPEAGVAEPRDGTGSIKGGYIATMAGSMLASPAVSTNGTIGTYDFGGAKSDVLLGTYGSGQTGPATVTDALALFFPASTLATFSFGQGGTEWGWRYAGNSTSGPWCNTGVGSSGDVVTH